MPLVKIRDNKVTIEDPKIPELEKQTTHSDEIGTIRGFLDWLFEEWMVDQAKSGVDTWSIRLNQLNRPQVINAFFDLDEDKMENQRRRLLMCQRIHNANNDLREDKKVQAMKEADRELYIHGQLLDVEKRERKELGVKG